MRAQQHEHGARLKKGCHRPDCEAKFWLHDLSVAVNAGFPAHEIGAIIRYLRPQRGILEGKWHEHFGN
jgi:hypothetical protein